VGVAALEVAAPPGVGDGSDSLHSAREDHEVDVDETLAAGDPEGDRSRHRRIGDFPSGRDSLRHRERTRCLVRVAGVWDTEEDNGVLIYVLLADHRVEILADRGFSAAVETDEWAGICRQMEGRFSEGRFEEGALCGVREVGLILTRTFPGEGDSENELPDPPVVL